jgi:hypothetical protein
MLETRRKFLAIAGMAPFALLAAASARAQTAPACYDPAALPLSQKSRRRSLGFLESAPDEAKRCGRCAFFTAAGPGCGTCQLLAGGPVNAGSVCNSFAPKAG